MTLQIIRFANSLRPFRSFTGTWGARSGLPRSSDLSDFLLKGFSHAWVWCGVENSSSAEFIGCVNGVRRRKIHCYD